MTIAKLQLGKSTFLDPMKLLEGRMLVVGNSGSGKSYLLRVLCEQIVDKIPTIILDREGEFSTLREKHDVALIGEGGEADVAVSTAAKLARTLVELGISAVINLSDLPSKTDKRRFVRVFLDALLGLPRSLWRPMIVIVDEAHEFCPEQGREAESRESVVRLMDSGRKRGICGILATQRFAKLAKDAAAEANNVCVGHIVQDVDLQRASQTLGFSGRSEWPTLRELDPGQWFAFGPAFDHKGIEKFTGLRANTTHPKPGQRHKLQAPAPSKAILKVAGDLKALKQAVADEQDELTRLRAENKQLRSNRPAPPVTAPVDTARYVLAGRDDVLRMIEPAVSAVDEAKGELHKAMAELSLRVSQLVHASARKNFGKVPQAAAATQKRLSNGQTKPVAHTHVRDPNADPEENARWFRASQELRRQQAEEKARRTRNQPSADSDPAVGKGGTRRMLVALAQHPEGLDRRALGLMAQLSSQTGTFSNNLGALRKNGWMEERGGKMFATEAGVDALGSFTPLPTGRALVDWWLRSVGTGGAHRVLRALVDAGGQLDRTALAQAADLSAQTGTYSNILGKLRGLCLIEGKGDLRLSDTLLHAIA